MNPAGQRRVCVVTGSRADYGLLYWVMRAVAAEAEFVLQVAVTGMHLAPEFGSTWRLIEGDGFAIDEKVETLMSSDTAVGVAKSVGLGVIGFAEAWSRLAPDLVLVLGDRYEIFAAVQAAALANIPVAHLAGGDATEGAVDDVLRHGITKMAHLHFTTNELARRRVVQMGETPERVFNVGSTGLDYVARARLIERATLESSLGLAFAERNFLVTFHPETLAGEGAAEQQVRELLGALDRFADGHTRFIVTRPNSDAGGRAIASLLDGWAAGRTDVNVFASLGQLRYLSVMAIVDVVIGNSSSGLYEVPSFRKPTVDIGERQRGRLRASSVVHCGAVASEIAAAVDQALGLDCRDVVNPYGDGNSSGRIIAELKRCGDFHRLVKKRFHDAPTELA